MLNTGRGRRNAKILKKSVRPIVHNQLIGKIRLSHKRQQPVIVGYLKRDMGIATHDDGNMMLLAQTQYLEIIVAGHEFSTHGSKRMIVDFEQRM